MSTFTSKFLNHFAWPTAHRNLIWQFARREVLGRYRGSVLGVSWSVLTPMAIPGIASTILLNIILAWNECFWTLNLTAAKAATLSAFIASYSSPEGLFYAKLSAASTMAIAPILILGWFSQKQLVRGLTFGAVK